MAETVTAIYEQGILRPLTPLALRERQTVQIQVIAISSMSEAERAVQILVTDGSLTPPPGRSDVTPVSEETRHKLADKLGKAVTKPLSELIVEERGE